MFVNQVFVEMELCALWKTINTNALALLTLNLPQLLRSNVKN
jgi:hypothetical protein